MKKFSLKLLLILIAAGIIISSFIFLWAIFLKTPAFGNFEEIKREESTKIYDRTGKIVLYDVFHEVKRTVVPFDEIPRNLKNATIAVEDSNFYRHKGVSFSGIARAFLKNLLSGRIKGQGGSTITQQLVKNAYLTSEKSFTRKIKEIAIALKIEKKYSKDEILELYLNEIPYGANNYGVEAAAEGYFGKHISGITLAESAYLAALPKAPTYYSPFGQHREELEKRKNFALQRMRELNFISEEDYERAKSERVEFLNQRYSGIRAPHFVMLILNDLVEKYGEEEVRSEGFKVITTLDFELQEKAEKIVETYAAENEKKFNAKNAALVAIDPKTGQIIALVGSRDYFDAKNDGNFNVATALRQPGSSFKPFVYATAFKKGYTPDTVLFDLKTNFAAQGAESYIPKNYDNIYRGPVTLRNALAQSINIPAVKVLYLSGIDDSIETAKALGITTLTDRSRYGLSLVLGGGEVKLLEMAGAYAIFANNGIKNEISGILEVRDKNNKVIEKFRQKEIRAVDENIARIITDILKDNTARAPAFGENSFLYFPGKEVAAKTGTTNNYRDAWVLGYTPGLAIGVWAGNNDNTPMEKKVAGFIAAPMWHAFFEETFKKIPAENFTKPAYGRAEKSVLQGEWRVGRIDGGKLITEPHTILYWVDKENPGGAAPQNPQNDSQFYNWEIPVREWARSQNIKDDERIDSPNIVQGAHGVGTPLQIAVLEPEENKAFSPRNQDTVQIKIQNLNRAPIKQIDFFFKNYYIGSLDGAAYETGSPEIYIFSFELTNFPELEKTETIKIKAYGADGSSAVFERNINII